MLNNATAGPPGRKYRTSARYGFAAILPAILILSSVFLLQAGNPYWNAQAQTILSIDTVIDANTTWNATAGPYYIDGNVYVETGATLTLEPGTEVRFDGFKGLYVNGTLRVNGTWANPVLITTNATTPAMGSWRALQVNTSGKLLMDSCEITYARWGIKLGDSTNASIINTSISNSSDSGIHATGASNATIFNVTLNSNGFAGVNMEGASRITLDMANITSGGYGVRLLSSDNVTVANTTIESVQYTGLYAYQSENLTLFNNTISSNSQSGIGLQETTTSALVQNNVVGNAGTGIYMYASGGNQILLNNVTENAIGIHIDASSKNTMRNNSMWDNTGLEFKVSANLKSQYDQDVDAGNLANNGAIQYIYDRQSAVPISLSGNYIFITASDSVVVSNASINEDGLFYLALVTNSTIGNVTATDAYNGIYLFNSHNNTIPNARLSASRDGIYFQQSSWNFVRDSFVTSQENGVTLPGFSHNNTFINVTSASTAGKGFNLVGADDCRISESVVSSGTGHAVSMIGFANNNTLDNSTAISNSQSAVYVNLSRMNRIENNPQLSSNSSRAVSVTWSDNTTITGNTISTEGGTGVFVSFWSDNVTVTGNTISSSGGSGVAVGYYSNNTAVHDNAIYYENGHGITIDHMATNITVMRNEINSPGSGSRSGAASAGIFLDGTFRSIIDNNTVSVTDSYGIYLLNALNNTLTSNTASAQDSTGMAFYFSDSNILFNNTFKDSYIGLVINDSKGNMAEHNLMAHNTYGTLLNGSVNSTVANNTFLENAVGIELDAATSGNLVAFNNFLNSVSYQAWDDGNNFWNTSQKGNFWTDYMGNDYHNGPWQDQPGADGIGDDPYPVGANTADMRPLMFALPDTSPPVVFLMSPENRSVISPGVSLIFSIGDANPGTVIYTINSGPPQALGYPYSVDTTTWQEGDYRVDINATDTLGYTYLCWFNFTSDKDPKIGLLSPAMAINPRANASVPVKAPGVILDFHISDLSLASVTYTRSGMPETLLSAPYDIDTSDWFEGGYNVTVRATDAAGGSTTVWVRLILDAYAPNIVLQSPTNNSVIPAGTTIDLALADIDPGVMAEYSADGVFWHRLISPYDVSVVGWSEGVNTLRVRANDTLGRTSTKYFEFTLDSILPVVAVNPPEGSIKPGGFVISVSISDTHLVPSSLYYKLDSSFPFSFAQSNPPYSIDTSGWQEGDHILMVSVKDTAGNERQALFPYIVDSTAPAVGLISPKTQNIIAGSPIMINVSDEHLGTVQYSLNSGPKQTLLAPYRINTSTWESGTYDVEVNASDLAGNYRNAHFIFTLDSSPPELVATTPEHLAVDVPISQVLIFTFNEALNITSSVPIVSIIPEHSTNLTWSSDGMSLRIQHTEPFRYGTIYIVTVSGVLKDRAGNLLLSQPGMTFTTEPPDSTMDTDADGMLDVWELQYDLDPYDPADAALDSDSDGHSNLEEYRANSNPRDAASKPEAPGLGEMWWLPIIIAAGALFLVLVVVVRRRRGPEMAVEPQRREDEVFVDSSPDTDFEEDIDKEPPVPKPIPQPRLKKVKPVPLDMPTDKLSYMRPEDAERLREEKNEAAAGDGDSPGEDSKPEDEEISGMEKLECPKCGESFHTDTTPGSAIKCPGCGAEGTL